MNTEFNNAINEIINNAIGETIRQDLKDGVITNLPENFELVTDFQHEIFKINDHTDKFLDS